MGPGGSIRGHSRVKPETQDDITHIQREWIVTPIHPECDPLSRSARISPLLAQLLLSRGVSTATDVRQFLSPQMSELLPPEELPGAVEAGKLLAAAARAGRKIVIYGDYDVDGVTATAILWRCLTLAGADVDFFIPSRFEEGYGVNADALRTLRADGADVVVTVDCGITACAEAHLAREIGLDLIVTDHHEPGGELPDVVACVHPTALGQSANPHLSGSAVAFKVAWAMAREFCGAERVTDEFREFLIEAVSLAALGLVADVVPLVGENRVIASYGLRGLRETKIVGLQALIDVSGLATKRSYDEYDVGFVLAPRLNAVGRLGHARLAVELFTRAGPAEAREIAATLDAQNRERQKVEKIIAERAAMMVVERGFNRESKRGIVLASAEWHRGVVGIVASRMVERFGRPTVLIALDGDEGQGSGRSIQHFPLNEVLADCAEHLLSCGGHAMAAGLRIAADRVEPFTEAFLHQAEQRLTPADLIPKLRLDAEVQLGELTLDLVAALHRMAPFGIGNPKPRLAVGPVELAEEPRVVGQGGKHLQFTVRQDGVFRKAIAFGRGDEIDNILDHRQLQIAFEPLINEWNGRKSVELRVIDWRPA